MFTQLLSQPPTPLNRARPNLVFNTAVEQVVMKGLSKSPKDRYPSVTEFAQALREALVAEPESGEGEGEGFFSKVKGLFKGKS